MEQKQRNHLLRKQGNIGLCFLLFCIVCFATPHQVVRILDDPRISNQRENLLPIEAGPVPAMSGSEGIHFKYVGSQKASVVIAIYDQVGQMIRRFTFNSVQKNSVFWTWDLTNKNGRKVGDGCYIAVCQSIGENYYKNGCKILLSVDSF